MRARLRFVRPLAPTSSMLTSNLLRARVRSGVVKCQYVAVDEETVGRAARMVAAFRDGVGGPKGAITSEVDDIVGHGTDFVLWRGLAKLCEDRSTYETVCAVDPVDLRRVVFEAAFRGAGPSTREAALQAAAAELGLEVAEVEEGMYADLDERQVLVDFDALEPEELVHRYNLALAQAVLFKALEMRVRIARPNPDRLRYVFSTLKFHGLMHRVRRDGDEVEVTIDGPASLLKMSRKYGLQMAVFLPALIHLDAWELEADIDWKGKERKFELSAEDGMVSHYRPRGQWRTDEEQWFEERCANEELEFDIERVGSVVELPDGEVLVADYVARAADGREAFIEIVSFWRAGYLRRRIEALSAIDVPFVLVVSERLKADREKIDAQGIPVVYYKGVIIPSKVVAAVAEALGS